MGDITAGMKGYSITYMSFVCRTFSVKRAVWAGALSCWNTLHRPPPMPPAPLRRCLGMKGMKTCLETLSLYQAALTFPLSKNTHTRMCFYKTGNSKAIKPQLRTFLKWQFILVCVPTYPNARKVGKFWILKIIKWQFCLNVCLVRISVGRKTKVNLGLRPRTGKCEKLPLYLK